MTAAAHPLLYKPKDAAAEIGIGRTKLFELMASGAIASVRIGHARRIPRAALEAYVAALLDEQTAAGA